MNKTIIKKELAELVSEVVSGEKITKKAQKTTKTPKKPMAAKHSGSHYWPLMAGMASVRRWRHLPYLPRISRGDQRRVCGLGQRGSVTGEV